MTDSTREAARRRQQRYRDRHRRIDYAPAADVAKLIADLRAANPTKCTADLLDQLIRAGHKALMSRYR